MNSFAVLYQISELEEKNLSININTNFYKHKNQIYFTKNGILCRFYKFNFNNAFISLCKMSEIH